MAINKNKNVLFNITISKADNEKLSFIVADLSRNLGIDLTKSQAISILIRNYGNKAPNGSKVEPKPKHQSALNYGAQIRALKDKLSVSFTELSNLLDIPPSTLKKYASDTQQPKEENERKIIDALKRYGIK